MFARIFRQDRLTYKQLQQQVAELAGLLARMGVAKGDRVLIYMPMVRSARAYALTYGHGRLPRWPQPYTLNRTHHAP